MRSEVIESSCLVVSVDDHTLASWKMIEAKFSRGVIDSLALGLMQVVADGI
jgi:hypothetical protein